MVKISLRSLFNGTFLRFAMVGASGFVVDVVAYTALLWLGTPHPMARAIAFLPAATSNWLLNRLVTFKSNANKRREWRNFLTASLCGFAINWGTYMLLASYIAWFQTHLWVAFIAGIALGLILNFALARYWVFERAKNTR